MSVFTIKLKKNKESAVYKSLYIKEELAKKITKLADKHSTSFNNIVISIIEYYFENEKK